MIAISLFDITGTMLKPWLESGYECHLFDIQHKSGSTTRADGMICHGYDLSRLPLPLLELLQQEIAFVSAFPPCTSLSVSGARWMAGKGLRALQDSVGWFATSAEFCTLSKAPYLIENPVSTIATYWRSSDHRWHPSWYAGYSGEQDNYTKETHLWVGGGYIHPERRSFGDLLDGPDTTYIHNMPPSDERANMRSATPEGFARAVFEANNGRHQRVTHRPTTNRSRSTDGRGP
jgi:hypothetical protein